MPRIRERSPEPGTFADRLNQVWERTGWPVSRVSEELRRAEGGERLKGTASVSLGRYLDGEVIPTIDMGVALASVLGVSPEWLLTGHGLPDPDALSDHVRPLWRIDGPLGEEHLPDTHEKRLEDAETFEDAFEPFREEWDQLSPTVQIMFGNLLARRMVAARHRREPWHRAFWRGQQAAKMGRGIIDRARRHNGPERVPDDEPLGSPAFSDLLLQLIAKALFELREEANPKEATHGQA